MHGFPLSRCALLIGLIITSCSPLAPPPVQTAPPGATAKQIVKERLSAVVVTQNSEIGSWISGRFSMKKAPKDADGGSAAPIAPDGYFLTADHVLARAPGRNVFIIYSKGGSVISRKARIVWRSEATDIAILHINEKTPYFYQWTPPGKWLPPGHGVIHGGMATGFSSAPGKLRTPLAPESTFTRNRPFKIDIPLKPGDSGGPIVDAYGNLVGINSAVEFLIPLETPIFIDSEGNRPNTKKIASIIAKDRRNRP